MALIILDRDGVINEDSDNYIRSLADWHPIPGSIEAIAQLSVAGHQIAVATNQSGLGRGYFDLDVLQAICCRLPIVNKLLQQGSFLQNFLSLLVIIPEFWPGNVRFQLRDTLTFAINVKGTSSAQRACPGGFSTIQFLHETL